MAKKPARKRTKKSTKKSTKKKSTRKRSSRPARRSSRKGLALRGGGKAVRGALPPWPSADAKMTRAVSAALKSGDFASHPPAVVGDFEKRFAKHHRRRYALMVNSGASALHAALAGCGVEPGDEVVTPAYAPGASTGCILHHNAIPVFVDVDPETLCLDPTKVASCITERTRAVLVVHLFGMPADLAPILKVAREHELAVLEDCSQAAGAKYRSKRVGTWGDVGAFDLGACGVPTALQGGMLLTNERSVYERALLACAHPERVRADVRDHSLQHYLDRLGFDFRPHPLGAAIAATQLTRLAGWVRERNRNFARLFQRVGEIVEAHGAEFLREHKGTTHARHKVSLKVLHDGLRELPGRVIAQALAAEGMPVGPYVDEPIPLRSRFRDLRFYGRGCPWTCRHALRLPDYSAGNWPAAERLCREGEIIIHGNHCVYDAKRMDQYARAIEKLVTHLDSLRSYAASHAGS